MKNFKLSSILILLLLVFLLTFFLNQSRKENNRIKANQNSLLSELKIYKTKDSLNVASVEKLTLTSREFEKYNQDLLKTVEDLNLKVRRLQSVSQSAIITNYPVNAKVKDSIIYVDNSRPPDTIRCIQFNNEWLKLDGCVHDHVFAGMVESLDTIVQVVHRVPRKFLFIRYGTKAIRQDVISMNPYSKVFFTKYIELKR